MESEIDCQLSPDRWETLKMLRAPLPEGRAFNRSIVEDLVALRLVDMIDGHPVISPWGRHVLLRGSPLLWDVAA